jgi:hypothetical protein
VLLEHRKGTTEAEKRWYWRREEVLHERSRGAIRAGRRCTGARKRTNGAGRRCYFLLK